MISSLILLVFSIPIISQTYLPASLCDDTLTLAGSPYIADSTIIINYGCALRVEPGVEIKMGGGSYMIIRGNVDFSGTPSQPILIHAKDSSWGIIYLDNANQEKSFFHYIVIEDATKGVYGISHNDSAFQQAALSCFNSEVEINHCVFKNNQAAIYCFYCNNILIKNCEFDSSNAGEKIHAEQSDSARIDSSVFYFTAGVGDAVDFDGSKDIIISNNYFYGGEADGIDIGNSGTVGCNRVTISGNFIFNMGDKGISCGEISNNIYADHNVIVGCDKGIVSKQGSLVFADHNTFYGNRIGILSTDYLDGLGPGNITLTNSIIAASSDSTWAKYFSSALTVSYSLSDIDLIPGNGNINNDPLFIFPSLNASGNFNLNSTSPAIDNGDPAFNPDPDGSRTDMGAFYYDKASAISFKNNIPGMICLYPNPVKQANTIYLLAGEYRQETEDYSGKSVLTIYNVLGEEVLKYKILSLPSKIQIGSLNAGIYFIKIDNGNEVAASAKMVVE